jgi:ketosteroid isomerase-like protein
MIKKLLFTSRVALLSISATACGDLSTQAGQKLSSEDLANVTAQVEVALWAFHVADTARNAEGVIDLLWPDYTMLVDGGRLAYADVVAGSRTFMATLELFHTEWTDVQVIPLGPDVAVTSFQFRDSIVTRSGELTQSQGPTTFVWQKRGGEWRVLFADADHYPAERRPGQ